MQTILILFDLAQRGCNLRIMSQNATHLAASHANVDDSIKNPQHALILQMVSIDSCQ